MKKGAYIFKKHETILTDISDLIFKVTIEDDKKVAVLPNPILWKVAYYPFLLKYLSFDSNAKLVLEYYKF